MNFMNNMNDMNKYLNVVVIILIFYLLCKNYINKKKNRKIHNTKC